VPAEHEPQQASGTDLAAAFATPDSGALVGAPGHQQVGAAGQGADEQADGERIGPAEAVGHEVADQETDRGDRRSDAEAILAPGHPERQVEVLG
jgi:hypothetical protein